MKRILQTLLLCALVTMTVQAKVWDDVQYKQIEQSIRVPQFANKEFLITKYGAKTTASVRFFSCQFFCLVDSDCKGN